MFTNEEKEIIKSHFQNYYNRFSMGEAGCKLFMFNLEQNLAFKDLQTKLNSAENKVFFVLLSNNNVESGYPMELVQMFKSVIK